MSSTPTEALYGAPKYVLELLTLGHDSTAATFPEFPTLYPPAISSRNQRALSPALPRTALQLQEVLAASCSLYTLNRNEPPPGGAHIAPPFLLPMQPVPFNSTPTVPLPITEFTDNSKNQQAPHVLTSDALLGHTVAINPGQTIMSFPVFSAFGERSPFLREEPADADAAVRVQAESGVEDHPSAFCTRLVRSWCRSTLLCKTHQLNSRQQPHLRYTPDTQRQCSHKDALHHLAPAKS